MKIIFDDEKQKRIFFSDLMGCPGRVGYKEDERCDFMDVDDLCYYCWLNCGIDIEVADGSDKVL